MSYTPWKQLERRHAARMKGKRLWRPDYSESIPDGESVTDAWDCKCYARHASVGMFVDAEKKYRDYTGKRRFHLVLFDRSRPRAGDFVLLRGDDFTALLVKAGEL